MDSLLANYASSGEGGTTTDSSDGGREETQRRARKRRQVNKNRAWLGEAELDEHEMPSRGKQQKKPGKSQPPQFVKSSVGVGVGERSSSPSPSPVPAFALGRGLGAKIVEDDADAAATPRQGLGMASMFSKPTTLSAKDVQQGGASVSPPPAAAAAAEKTDAPAEDPTLPPKTKSKFSIVFASPQKPPPQAEEKKITNADRERSIGFLGDVGKGTSKKLFMMMKRAGWTPGKGMGKNEQGHSEAVDVKLRPKMAGVGAIDEKTDQQKRRERRDKGEPEPEDVAPAARPGSALTSGSPIADMFGGMTVGEDGKVSLSELAHVKLEVRAVGKSSAWKKMKRERKAVVEGMGQGFGGEESAIVDYRKSVTPPPEEEGLFAVVEDTTGGFLADLKASIMKLLDEASSNARDIDSRLTQEESRRAAFQKRIDEGAARREEQAKSEGNLDIVVSFIDRLKGKIDEGIARGNAQINPITLARALDQKIVSAGAEYHGTYKLLSEEIAALMLTAALPLFQQLFSEWSPRGGDAIGQEELGAWKTLLGANLPLYHKMVWDLAGGKLQGYIATAWDVYHPADLVGVLGMYFPYLSARGQRHLIENGVVPRLLQGIARFEEQAGVRLHDFIVPWVKYTVSDDAYPVNVLEERGVLSAVREKLIKLLALVDHVEAYESLYPWKVVLHPKQYNTLRDRYGTGRCGEYVAKLAVDPRCGDAAADKALKKIARGVEGVVRWATSEPKVTSVFITALTDDLAPRMTYVLAVFARAQRENLAQAVAYYKAWKALLVAAMAPLPEAARAAALRALYHPAAVLAAAAKWWARKMRGELEKSEGDVEMGEEGEEGAHLFDVGAVNQHAVGKLKLSKVAAQLHLPTGHHVPHHTVTREGIVLEDEELSLREQIETLAAEEDFPFHPRADHHRVDGNRVYALGEVSVYFHANCLFYQHQGEWAPAPSIKQVFDTARRVHAKRQKRDGAPSSSPHRANAPPPAPSDTMELD